MKDQELFKLRITDLEDAIEVSKSWATHVVSILDIDLVDAISSKTVDESEIPMPRPGLSFHRSCFDDVISQNSHGYILATLEDIRAILEFTKELTANSNLLVHCMAGISRSTAVACGILCQHGLSPEEAIKMVCEIRKGAYPNMHIMWLMDKALKLNGSLVNAYMNSSCFLG